MKKITKFIQLSYHERCLIYRGLCQKKSIRVIAKELGRAVSTITREIARNSDRIGYLYPGKAHEMAQKRKRKNEPIIDNNPTLRAYIIEKLKERWSPKIIAKQWSLDHNGDSICKETIYKWLYANNSSERVGLRKLLVRSHKKRGVKFKKK